MATTVSGTFNGDSIKLDQTIDLALGQKVEVVVHPIQDSAQWGDGLRRCAGMLADEPQLDEALEEIYRDRKKISFRDAIE